MPFKMPEVLPTGADELAALRGQAAEEFETLRSRVDAGEALSDDELGYLRDIVDALSTVDNALSALATDESRAAEIRDLIEQGSAGPEDEDEESDGAEVESGRASSRGGWS